MSEKTLKLANASHQKLLGAPECTALSNGALNAYQFNFLSVRERMFYFSFVCCEFESLIKQ